MSQADTSRHKQARGRGLPSLPPWTTGRSADTSARYACIVRRMRASRSISSARTTVVQGERVVSLGRDACFRTRAGASDTGSVLRERQPKGRPECCNQAKAAAGVGLDANDWR